MSKCKPLFFQEVLKFIRNPQEMKRVVRNVHNVFGAKTRAKDTNLVTLYT